MVNEITTVKNYTVRINSMIYLFDNCYLSTTNSIVEKAKQIWIGSHLKLDQDPMLNFTYDILHSYKEINDDQLEDLFNEIHEDYSDIKTVIYCDVENFMYVYSYFFNGILEKSAVKELYSFDRLKENYRIGVFATRDVEFVDLPETLEGTDTASTFSSLLTYTRIEIAYANYVAGNTDYEQYCVDRVCAMYDGSAGSFSSYIEQNIPAVLEDSEYTIENILNADYIQNIVDQYKTSDVISRDTISLLEQEFGYDHYNHFANVVNNNNIDKDEQNRISEDVCSLSKEAYVLKYLINPEQAIKFQLVFPTFSNFDSINPILWNKILENRNDSEWLSKFKVNNGTNNQTDGTV